MQKTYFRHIIRFAFLLNFILVLLFNANAQFVNSVDSNYLKALHDYSLKRFDQLEFRADSLMEIEKDSVQSLYLYFLSSLGKGRINRAGDYVDRIRYIPSVSYATLDHIQQLFMEEKVISKMRFQRDSLRKLEELTLQQKGIIRYHYNQLKHNLSMNKLTEAEKALSAIELLESLTNDAANYRSSIYAQLEILHLKAFMDISKLAKEEFHRGRYKHCIELCDNALKYFPKELDIKRLKYSAKELLFYHSALQTRKLVDYEDYVFTFPKGEFKDEIIQKIDERYQFLLEDTLCQDFKVGENIMMVYIDKYPDGKLVSRFDSILCVERYKYSNQLNELKDIQSLQWANHYLQLSKECNPQLKVHYQIERNIRKIDELKVKKRVGFIVLTDLANDNGLFIGGFKKKGSSFFSSLRFDKSILSSPVNWTVNTDHTPSTNINDSIVFDNVVYSPQLYTSMGINKNIVRGMYANIGLGACYSTEYNQYRLIDSTGAQIGLARARNTDITSWGAMLKLGASYSYKSLAAQIGVDFPYYFSESVSNKPVLYFGLGMAFK